MSKSILLVEDDLAFASMIELLLDEFAIKHVTTASGAAQWLKDGFRTDVVFLDLSLPDSEGVETVVKIAEVAQGVPVIVMTGMDDDGDLWQRVMLAGAQDYIQKGKIRGGYWLRMAIRHAITGKYQALQWQSDRKQWETMLAMKAEIDDIINTAMSESMNNDMARERFVNIYKGITKTVK